MADYIRCDEDSPVRAMAKELIEDHHEHLREARFEFLFREFAARSRGKTIVAKAILCSPRDRTLHGADFIIEIAQDEWASMPDEARRALIDHELCHCDVKRDEFGSPIYRGGELQYCLRPHDIEEFAEIVERYGLWNQDLREHGKAFQLRLFDDERVDQPNNKVFIETGIQAETGNL